MATPTEPGWWWARLSGGDWEPTRVVKARTHLRWVDREGELAPLDSPDATEWGPRIPEPHHHPDSRWWAKQVAEALDHVDPGCAEGIEDNADGRRLAASLIEGLEPKWRRAHAIADIKALRLTHEPGETEARRAHVISWTNAIDAAMAILRGEKPEL